MESQRLVTVRLFEGVEVAETAAVTSAPIDVSRFTRVESLVLTASSTDDAHDFQVEVIPVGEIAGTALDSVAPIVLTGSTVADFPAVDDTGLIALSFPPTLTPRIKIRVTGVGANPADTVLDAVLYGREGA